MVVKIVFDILLIMVIMFGVYKGVLIGICCVCIKGGYMYYGKEFYIRKKNFIYEYGFLLFVFVVIVVLDVFLICVIGYCGNCFGL